MPYAFCPIKNPQQLNAFGNPSGKDTNTSQVFPENTDHRPSVELSVSINRWVDG
jgi:hypothetical protein